MLHLHQHFLKDETTKSDKFRTICEKPIKNPLFLSLISKLRDKFGGGTDHNLFDRLTKLQYTHREQIEVNAFPRQLEDVLQLTLLKFSPQRFDTVDVHRNILFYR